MRLIVGYHGKKNFGDDIILNDFLKENEGEDFLLYTYSFISGLKNIKKQYIWNRNKLNNILSFLSACFKCSEIIWIGGTCFSDEDGVGGYNYINLARILNIKYSYLYIGVNDLKEQRNIIKARKLLEGSKRLLLRDEASKSNCIKIVGNANLRNKIDISKDLGFLYLNRFEKENNIKKENNLLISWRDLVRYFNKDKNKAILDSVVKFIDENHVHFDKVILINADENIDFKVSEYILSKSIANNTFYQKNASIDEKLNLISSSKVVFTSRLHVAIAGNEFNCKTYVFSYSDKIKYQCHGESYNIFEMDDLFSRRLGIRI